MFLNQSDAGIRCSQNFFVNNLERVIFDSCNHGIVVAAGQADLNTFIRCRFEELNHRAVDIVNGQANTFIGCRFEARSGATGQETIGLNNCDMTVFQGCYFEDTFETLLAEINSKNTACFRDCRFSGQENTGGGLQPEVFVSNGIVLFENNQFAQGSNGPNDMALVGANVSLGNGRQNIWRQYSNGNYSAVTRQAELTSGAAMDLLTFTRVGTADSQNRQLLSGFLGVTITGRNNAGTIVSVNRTYQLSARGQSNSTIVLDTDQIANQDHLPARAQRSVLVRKRARHRHLRL